MRGQALRLLFMCLWIAEIQAQAFIPIRTCLELQAMEDDLGGDYELMNDIDCAETAAWNGGQGFNPVGYYIDNDSYRRFTGTFQGNHHIIFNLTINRPTTSRSVGLFGYTYSLSRIHNVGLKNAQIAGNDFVGALAGWSWGMVSSCFVEEGNIQGSDSVGGLAGGQYGLTVESYAENIYVTGSSYVGGLVGYSGDDILSCHSTGRVSGATAVGGLVGILSTERFIVSAYSNCEVMGSGDKVGGLVGNSERMIIELSYALGDVRGASGVGGLVGSGYGITIENSYAGGDVVGTSNVGGLLGEDWRQNLGSRETIIENSYAKAQVVGSSTTGGLIGKEAWSISVQKSYWDVEISGQSTSDGGEGRITADMQQHSTFTGWDFTSIWFLRSGYTYPLLRAHIALPLLENAIVPQRHFIGQFLSFTLPADIFIDPNGLLLIYEASLVSGFPLPPWLAFLKDTQTFVGTPLSGAQGSLEISVKACNVPDKCTSTTFTLTLPNRAPTVQSAIPAQTARNGVAFQFIVPEAAFFDDDGDKLDFSAKALDGGPLPAWLQFNSVLGIFSGTATTRGTFWVNLTVSDGFGGAVSTVFEIVTPNSAPIVTTPYPNQVATLRQPFAFSVPSGSFYDLDDDILVFGASLFGGGELLPWIVFDPEAITFSGVSENVGFLMLAVIATDPFNATASLSFGLTISEIAGNHPPILAIKIPAQTGYTKREFTFIFAEGTFEDPDGGVLSYSATLEGGGALPDWLTFANATRTFSGLPVSPEILRVTVRATDVEGAYALDTFTLTIEDTTNQPPVVKNSIGSQVAQVGQLFSLLLKDTFIDVNYDDLNVTVSQAGGRSLPEWLGFDPILQALSGKPGMWHTDFYADRQHTIEVRASDGQASVVETFYLFVEGESFWELFIKAAAPIGTILSVLFAGYRYYYLLWNWFAGRKYRAPRQITKVGEEYNFTLTSLPQLKNKANEIEYVQVFIAGKRLTKKQLLPNWLQGSTLDTLSGTPQENDVGIITVRVYGYDGRILAEFELHVYQAAEESGAKSWQQVGSQTVRPKRRHHVAMMTLGNRSEADGGEAGMTQDLLGGDT